MKTPSLLAAVALSLVSWLAPPPASAEGDAAPTPVPTESAPAPSAAHAGVAPGEPRSKMGFDFSLIARLPVQAGGRLKPLDTYAREIMLHQTGSRFFDGWAPVDLALSFMVFPDAWENRTFIQVTRPDVRRQIGLDESRSRFAPHELVSESYLVQYVREMGGQATTVGIVGQKDKSDPREDELKRVLERIALYRRVVAGEAWPLIPVQGEAAWLSLSDRQERGVPFRAAFAKLAVAYRDGDKDAFAQAAALVTEESKRLYDGDFPKLEKELRIEHLYNWTHPFLWSWIFYLVAGILWAVALVTAAGDRRGSAKWRRPAMALTWLGLAMHVYGFSLRCYVAGRPPVTNMYESIIWVTLGAVVFAFVIYAFQRQAILLATACVVGALAMVAADAAPAMMDPGIHPLVPVLRSNYWLTVHVLTITLGYSAFLLAMGLGNVTLWHYLRNPKDLSTRVANLNQLTYRATQIGVVLLAAGTILGGIWADYSWGRFWGWDPKEVWALIALMNYLIVLHARYAGYVRQLGFALWSVLAFMGVVMAWYGVNFVLGVGLHSYGFSTGGRGTVAAFCLAQILYCVVVWLTVKGRAFRTAKT